MRVALGIEYDGAGFCGWQTQPSGCGIQDNLEAALALIADEPVHTVCAGRTDAGVHALEQVVHFDTAAQRPLSAWVRGVNATLSQSVAVIWAREVSAEFNARYGALKRHYRYVLLNHAVRPATAHARVGWFHAPLDVDAMREAAQLFLGEHDFSAFRSSECQARSPVRHMHTIEIYRHGAHIVFDFCANAFLHHMVRNLMGTLLYVGKGKHPPKWAAHLLAARERALAAPTLEAAGLYLARVEYDAKWQLPFAARAIATPLFAETRR
jgi:tRNA pseudouridine38-40 synthase